MKKLLRSKNDGESSLVTGLIAVGIILSIALGCTCNEEMFDFAKNAGDSSTERTDSADDEAKPDDDADRSRRKADASKREIPEEAEMQEIVKTTLLDFDDALKKEDFTDFHSNISDTWKRQVTPRQLKRMFQSFIDGKADLSPIRTMKAKFDSGPELNESSGLEFLEVTGSYDTEVNPTSFELKYLAEGEDWKLASIFVRTTLYQQP